MDQRSGDPKTFDLTALAAADRALKRGMLYVMVALLVGLGAETVYGATRLVPYIQTHGIGNANSPIYLFALVFQIGILTFIGLAVPSFVRGAARLRVDDSGLQLFYSQTRSNTLRWTGGPGFRLFDWSAYPALVDQGTAYCLYGTHFWNRRNLLTRQAVDAILSRAEAVRAHVTRRDGNPIWYGRVPSIYRIGYAV